MRQPVQLQARAGRSRGWVLYSPHCCRRGSDLSESGDLDRPARWLVLLFTSFFAISLACQRLFYTALFTGLQVEGMTFHFLNDVFLLNLAFEPAQCIFKRLAFLNANLCQRTYTSRRPTVGKETAYRKSRVMFHPEHRSFVLTHDILRQN
jgi:hypothetical protein